MTTGELPKEKSDLLPEAEIPDGRTLLAEGAALAGTWSVGRAAFQRDSGFVSEFDFKQQAIADGRVMQHAHLGFRDLGRTCAAAAEIHETCAREGVTVDRFGMCLDWSMGLPRARRREGLRGTGILLDGPEDFIQLTEAAPAAMHFGDFMLGFPAALENTCAALAAGATAIGNLGQYFTFRLPGHDDEVETTAATVQALGLIAAQDVPVLVHSNLDDGFAAVFEDLSTALGFAMLEKHIVTGLIGARYAVCYGHHFTEPVTRIAFQQALNRICDGVPGSQVYGATVLYKGEAAANFASMASYLLADIIAQRLEPSGHAVNPVPVTENSRIPDMAEVIDAQLHLGRLSELAEGYLPLIDMSEITSARRELLRGAEVFRANVMGYLDEIGIDTADPFQMLLALRRLGGRRLERAFGAGAPRPDRPGRRQALVPATTVTHLEAEAAAFMATDAARPLAELGRAGLCVLTATTDVHEHGKMLLDDVFLRAGIALLDGGISAEPEAIVDAAVEGGAQVIALSTYNGVALTFATRLREAMAARGLDLPILIGGRLNQVPEGSNSSLPVDVADKLAHLGVHPCRTLDEAVRVLSEIAKTDYQ